jgi:hypothetical protein
MNLKKREVGHQRDRIHLIQKSEQVKILDPMEVDDDDYDYDDDDDDDDDVIVNNKLERM